MMHGRRIAALLGASALLGPMAPAAGAQQFEDYGRAAADQYGPPPATPTPRPRPSGGVAGERANGDEGGVPAEQGQALPLHASREQRLPFTGLNLDGLILVGVALTAAGLVLRLVARRRTPGSA
jgi:hypothetical protein